VPPPPPLSPLSSFFPSTPPPSPTPLRILRCHLSPWPPHFRSQGEGRHDPQEHNLRSFAPGCGSPAFDNVSGSHEDKQGVLLA
jgi:hypothetical protein